MGAVTRRTRSGRVDSASLAAAAPVLDGFGVVDPAARRAILRRAARAGTAPAGTAAAGLEAALGAWFARLFDWPANRAATALAAGRLVWLEIEAGRRWPDALLSPDPLPDALARLVIQRRPAPPPIELPAPMPAADLAPVRLGVPGLKPARRSRSA